MKNCEVGQIVQRKGFKPRDYIVHRITDKSCFGVELEANLIPYLSKAKLSKIKYLYDFTELKWEKDIIYPEAVQYNITELVSNLRKSNKDKDLELPKFKHTTHLHIKNHHGKHMYNLPIELFNMQEKETKYQGYRAFFLNCVLTDINGDILQVLVLTDDYLNIIAVESLILKEKDFTKEIYDEEFAKQVLFAKTRVRLGLSNQEDVQLIINCKFGVKYIDFENRQFDVKAYKDQVAKRTLVSYCPIDKITYLLQDTERGLYLTARNSSDNFVTSTDIIMNNNYNDRNTKEAYIVKVLSGKTYIGQF